jgi:short-subunit dehydrogenase
MKNSIVAIVIGSTGGIGQAICHSLLTINAKVIAVGRNLLKVKKLADELNLSNSNIEYYHAEFEFYSDYEKLFANIKNRYNKIDVLINSSGQITPGPLTELRLIDIENMISTNFMSIVNSVKAILPIMKKQGNGHIINIGSVGGIVPMPYESIYCATKFAIRGFTLSIRKEVEDYNIHTSLLSPGSVKTKMLEDESRHLKSTMSFTNKYILPKRVGDAILSLIKKPKPEKIIPLHLGLPSWALGLSPKLFHFLYPFLDRVGLRNLKKFNKLLE